MMTSEIHPVSPEPNLAGIPSRLRIRFGLVITVLGLLMFLLGARPSIIGLDSSPEVSFGQIAFTLVGLAIICLGGFFCLMTFWKNGSRTLAADIGSRLVATGYVVVFFAGMADIFGITQATTKTQYFGPWQAVGVQIGEAVIALGFVLLIPYRRMTSKKPGQNPTNSG